MAGAGTRAGKSGSMRAQGTVPAWAVLSSSPRNSRARTLGWEKRRENDERVTVNLRPQDHALWRQTRSQFKGSPEQRLKAFTQYAHDHPGESMRAIQRNADRSVDRMISDYNSRPRIKKTTGFRPRMTRASSDVPF